MKTKKRKIALIMMVIISMVMTAFVPECVPYTSGNKVNAATEERLQLTYGRKKLLVGMGTYPTLKKGEKELFSNEHYDMIWKSSNKKVATVGKNGGVTAKKAGTVTITVTDKKDKRQKASFKIVVVNSISGTYKKTKWKLTKKGELEVKGNGNMYAKGKLPPWCKSYNSIVKSAKIDVKGATNLSRLFSGCRNLKGVDLSKLDTSKVTDMSYMFGSPLEYCGVVGTNKLEKLDLSGFNTSKVTDMKGMFAGCKKLERLNLKGWDTSKVTDMSYMFHNCGVKKLKLDLSGFDTSKVEDMHSMFLESHVEKLDLSGFDTSKVTDMHSMFDACSMKKLDVSGFNTSKVTDMHNMFRNCYALEKLDVRKFNTSKVVSMYCMFADCKKLKSLDVSGFDTSKVEKMNSMFQSCYALEKLDLSTFDTSHVTAVGSMFENCRTLKELKLSDFDTSKTTSMNEMFAGCYAVEKLDLSSFDTSNVSFMNSMFKNCKSLKELDLSNFDTSQLKYMDEMFTGCESLAELNISSFDISHLLNDGDYNAFVFYKCKSLSTIHTPKKSAELVPALPEGIWTDGSGQNYTTLPANATGSAVLVKVIEG